MAPAFPHARTFVVQLSSDADHGRLVGRVEHVDSGRSTRFASPEEMSAFFALVLCEAEEPESGEDTGNPARKH